MLLLGLGDQEPDRIAQWEVDTGLTFPLLIGQDTYDLYVDPGGAYYSLTAILDKQGVVRFLAHESNTADKVAMIEQLLAEP